MFTQNRVTNWYSIKLPVQDGPKVRDIKEEEGIDHPPHPHSEVRMGVYS